MENSAKKVTKRPKLYLLDGSGYIFRAFYAVAPLTTKSGFPTNALFGFSRMVLKLLKEVNKDHIAVCFDAGKKTFRNELYDQYKANRTTPPDELIQQFPYFQEITKALGLPTFSLEGFEADDIIATFANDAVKNGFEVVVVSGDKDLLQLVSNDISVWDTMRDKRYAKDEVKEKLGVYPESVRDFLALVGDSSDNVPGLEGVGPKTAVQLIENYGGIESIIQNVENIRENKAIRGRVKIAETIELDPGKLRLSSKLVSLDSETPIYKNMSESEQENPNFSSFLEGGYLDVKEPSVNTLKGLIENFEFGDLFKDALNKNSLEKLGEQYKFTTIWKENFTEWLNQFKNIKEFAIDTETTSLDPKIAEIVGVSICWNNEEAFYIPLNHKKSPKEQVSKEVLLGILQEKLELIDTKIIGQNLKFDMQVFKNSGISFEVKAFRQLYFDTMIAAYLINSEGRSYSLDVLAEEYLGRGMLSYEQTVSGLEDFSYVPVELATKYAADDALVAWLLKAKLAPLLKEQNLLSVFETIEMPLVTILATMEDLGIEVDKQFLEKMSEDIAKKLENLEKEILSLAGGEEFNLNSPKQLSEILFTKLGISTKGIKKTKTGISTDAKVLEKLKDKHPIINSILEYRLLYKLKSTYVDALPKEISSITGRIHSKFQQAVTGTGRLSSIDPNLQNIPIQSQEGRKIRGAFRAKEGYQLISADYSQVELRILAHMSGDQSLMQAFKDGTDIHTKTAREILYLGDKMEVTTEQRRLGKTINFGMVYGMSAFRLAGELGIPVGVADEYIKEYFARYSKVKKYFHTLEEAALKEGEVRTLFGRKRSISNLDTSDRDKGFLLRVAINAPIQGTAADVIKLSMINVDKVIRQNNAPISLLLQVHDELLFECRDDYVEKGQSLIKEAMENAIQLDVPLLVDVRTSKTWEKA